MVEDVFRLLLTGRRHVERGHAIDVLALDPEDFAAGGQDRGPRAQAHEHLGQGRRRINKVLAVVQHQQKVPAADGARDGLGGDFLCAQLEPSVLATVDGTSVGSDSEASSTSHPPSVNSPRMRRASFKASVVFPMPPGPVRVTTR